MIIIGIIVWLCLGAIATYWFVRENLDEKCYITVFDMLIALWILSLGVVGLFMMILILGHDFVIYRRK